MMAALLAVAALAGDVDGEVSVDSLAATSRGNAEGSGDPLLMTAVEIGMRLRGELHELDDRLEIAVDYRGREPIAGTLADEQHRLLYAAKAQYEVLEDRLVLGAGRFIAPSAVLLPVDGVYADLHFDAKTTLSAFGGRRGFTTSRKNLGFDQVLPAFGLSLDRVSERYMASVLVAHAEDEFLVATDRTEIVPALSAVARGSGRPHEDWNVGGQLSLVQAATYVLGPTWADATVEAQTLDLFSGLLYTDWRPGDDVRIDVDVHHQQAAVFRERSIAAEGPAPTLERPDHTDLRLRTGWSPADGAWLRPETRFRLRPERAEIRYGGAVDIDTLPVPGLYLDGRLFIDDIQGDDSDNVGAVDRLVWSTAVGFDHEGLDVSAGTSFIERAAAPVSGRTSSVTDPGAPADNSDLSPFVLEAQNIVFLRGFYSAKRWFVGLDAEKNLADAELRALVQVGALTEAAW